MSRPSQLPRFPRTKTVPYGHVLAQSARSEPGQLTAAKRAVCRARWSPRCGRFRTPRNRPRPPSRPTASKVGQDLPRQLGRTRSAAIFVVDLSVWRVTSSEPSQCVTSTEWMREIEGSRLPRQTRHLPGSRGSAWADRPPERGREFVESTACGENLPLRLHRFGVAYPPFRYNLW
jgi:hypothetical protein